VTGGKAREAIDLEWQGKLLQEWVKLDALYFQPPKGGGLGSPYANDLAAASRLQVEDMLGVEG
jgi:hypothetical protein